MQNRKPIDIRWELALLLLAVFAIILPIWLVTAPPSTDLPQHLSQVYLLEQLLAGKRPDLTITPWYYPNTLIYIPLYIFWKFSSPLTAGKLILSFLSISWIVSTYALAKSRSRSFENWLITTPLVFNFLMIWGLLNFLIGWPIFCIFLIIISKKETKFQPWLLMLTLLLLYYAHSLWFAMANVCLWLLLIHQKNHNWKKFIAASVPIWIMAMAWYPKLVVARRTSGVKTEMYWEKTPWEHLDFNYIVDSALGALYGPIESVYIFVLFIWVISVLIGSKKSLENDCDISLFLSSGFLLLLWWSLPNFYVNTVFFSERWFPFFLVIFIISIPGPKQYKNYFRVVTILFLIIFSAATLHAWTDWDKNTEGFWKTITKINSSDSVLGLNLQDDSLLIKGRPGMQLFSYIQFLQGAKVHFDFTEHFSGIVQFKTPSEKNLHWVLVASPLLALKSDLSNFNRVLINANSFQHEVFSSRLPIQLISSTDSDWRLYRVIKVEN